MRAGGPGRGGPPPPGPRRPPPPPPPDPDRDLDLERCTIADLQGAMAQGHLTSERLTLALVERIERLNPLLRAVTTVNPDAVALSHRSDALRRAGRARGPLEGIPILLKDNVGTADRQPTTAGSTALLGARPGVDAFLVRRLREAGAVILGKANMTEWADFRSEDSVAGWSATGGQTRNPYVLDRSPSGSSSGSAVAVAAGLAVAAIGTETDGSVVLPASVTGTVGFKPTRGLVSRGGIVPLSTRQDTAGPLARTVADAALVLWAIHGPDPADPVTARAGSALPAGPGAVLDRGALRGRRVGVRRPAGLDPWTERVFDDAVERIRGLGAVLVEDVDLPDTDEEAERHLEPALLTEFRHDVGAWLAATPGSHPKNLAGVIAYNVRHAATELALFGQDVLERAERTGGDLRDPVYRRHRAAAVRLARRALDGTLARHRLDVLVTPTAGPAPLLAGTTGDGPYAAVTRDAAVAGNPHVTVPAGYAHGVLPLGVSFVGARGGDALVLGCAYAFEQAGPARTPPCCLPTLP
ncbi:amidase [Streptomyces sp. NPDC021100]|uniref:amidase n=1 Tax=Streptomyces sp. NPDC021100 TaxID=3365114 RepID=UPI0037A10382